MQVIVILNVFSVARPNLAQERNQLVSVNLDYLRLLSGRRHLMRRQVQHHLVHCHGEDVRPLQRFCQTQRVEVKRVDTLKVVGEAHLLSVHLVRRGMVIDHGKYGTGCVERELG